VVVGRTTAALGPAEAARFVVAALREAAGADAAFIGNTTFGAGLPGGAVTREEFDACVRFDGTIFTAEVDGARLRLNSWPPPTSGPIRRSSCGAASSPSPPGRRPSMTRGPIASPPPIGAPGTPPAISASPRSTGRNGPA
jgi:hypothetical protein